jgi:transglutaminase-like putative cysteine protease
MIVEVQHETRFEYSEPVRESMTEVRLEPQSDSDQSCHSFRLEVNPPAEVFRYQDGFGNRVHHFNLMAPHAEISIRAASVVETHPQARDPSASRATWPLDATVAGLDVLDFLKLRGPVRSGALLEPVLDALRPHHGVRLGELVASVSRYIHEHFEYAKDVTLASSPVDDLLQHGKGVCQDFTHLMIAVLRSFGVPARYVSGYVHRPNKESQSHAWCEVWLPDLGWLGVDPTNDRAADAAFVKVATGRDFTDVPPNKGTYRGRGRESILVRVETRELERLPSLSWQEQLPPLQVPLTAIVSKRPYPEGQPEQDSQQQQ